MDRKKYPELLAPAGSFQTLEAVIAAGADAVYLGGSQFGARAYAQNFTKEELLDAIDYAHLYGRRLYLTVNTLLKQEEMETLCEYLLPYYEQGLDAVIVQDFGVMRMIHENFPELAVHISTQASVASAYGFSFFQKHGAVRIVPARELSLQEISAIRRQTDMEIECFVHGALCYCYSGQCLFSSMLGGRSGNRGRCAQPCRLAYTALDENRRRISAQECYLLSPKDLCTVSQIPQLIAAGIDSFKIEGRMKSAQYAARVTSVYKKYICQYLEQGTAQVHRKDQEALLAAGNRSGFTDGYFTRHNGPDMITMQRPNHEKTDSTGLDFIQKLKIPVFASASFRIGKPAVMNVSCRKPQENAHASAACPAPDEPAAVSVQGAVTQEAQKQPLSREMIETQLSKTGGTPFAIEHLELEMDEAVFQQKKDLNELRRSALDGLYQKLLSQCRRVRRDAASGWTRDVQGTAVTSPCCGTGRNAASGWTKAVQETAIASGAEPEQASGKAARRPYFTAAIEDACQLPAVLEQDFISRIYLDGTMYTHKDFAVQLQQHAQCIHAAGKEAYLSLPSVFRQKTAQFYKTQWESVKKAGIDGFLAKNADELGFLEEMQADKTRCILDHSLYAYSGYAKTAYAAAGWVYDTVPLELNKKELRARGNTHSELIIYGHLPLMTSAQCIKKTLGRCSRMRGICYLKDRYAKELPVRSCCSECYNTVYNAQPLSLIQLSEELDCLQAASFRLWFTIETEEKTRRISACCREAFLEHKKPDMHKAAGAYTNGHYKRGAQ